MPAEVLPTVQTDTITSSGTWTVPAGVTSITVVCIGGGGGGLGSTGSADAGGGGGGGATAVSVLTVTPGQDFIVEVGADADPNHDGDDVSFGGDVIAKAGTAGSVRNGGLASQCTGQTKYNGGNGGAGHASFGGGGGGGSSAGNAAVGSNGASGGAANGGAGGVAPTGGGNGGEGGSTSLPTADDATIYGGGGGGAGNTDGVGGLGGKGRHGVVRVSYYGATFSSNSSFTVPDCINTLTVVCVGAGGGGSNGFSNSGQSGGGAGGGGAASVRVVTVTPGQVIPLTVGVGGTAGVAGTLTRFGLAGDAWEVKAAGGLGSSASESGVAGGAVADCLGDLKYAGGFGAAGTRHGGGGAGSSGGTDAAGDDGGDGEPEAGGAGGIARTEGGGGGGGGAGGVAGSNGSAPGGGGGGGGGAAVSAGAGGTGGVGKVTVSWSLSPYISGIRMTATNALRVGQAIEIFASTSQNVTVAGGTPSIGVTINGNVRPAVYTGSTSSRTLRFRYDVVTADVGEGTLVTASSVTLNGATIRDSCGNNILNSFDPLSQFYRIIRRVSDLAHDFFDPFVWAGNGEPSPPWRFRPSRLGD